MQQSIPGSEGLDCTSLGTSVHSQMLRHQGRPFAEWTNPPSYTVTVLVLLESEFTRLETQLITPDWNLLHV
jgi:hypothetical protein